MNGNVIPGMPNKVAAELTGEFTLFGNLQSASASSVKC